MQLYNSMFSCYNRLYKYMIIQSKINVGFFQVVMSQNEDQVNMYNV